MERLSERLNWLRAGVLGANDGIVSVAAVVVGVAAATPAVGPILTAGFAATVGGAISMALGEYVSVSSSSDSQKALVGKERRELTENPEGELEELIALYRDKGISEATAHKAATEITEQNALGAHLAAEYGIDENDILNPWHAALASGAAFVFGAVLPMLAIWLPSESYRLPVTFVSVLTALGLTGWLAAVIGGSPRFRAAVRVVAGGTLALAATFVVGQLLGASGVV